MVDAAAGIGNGRLVPSGPLRERVDDALARASAIVLTGRGHAGDGIAARARVSASSESRRLCSLAACARAMRSTRSAFSNLSRKASRYPSLIRRVHPVTVAKNIAARTTVAMESGSARHSSMTTTGRLAASP
ncbi:tetraacyldisaccharide 4'-kinase [Parvibaculum sp.]|uniref:tetraacyldisaccharide 4'-kinase n=1 Tax=Parvibaculum sp. TaxID=2024848 RepID=UPI00341299E8